MEQTSVLLNLGFPSESFVLSLRFASESFVLRFASESFVLSLHFASESLLLSLNLGLPGVPASSIGALREECLEFPSKCKQTERACGERESLCGPWRAGERKARKEGSPLLVACCALFSSLCLMFVCGVNVSNMRMATPLHCLPCLAHATRPKKWVSNCFSDYIRKQPLATTTGQDLMALHRIGQREEITQQRGTDSREEQGREEYRIREEREEQRGVERTREDQRGTERSREEQGVERSRGAERQRGAERSREE
jgi:hypothetical protein